MTLLRLIYKEVTGMFIDDGSLALWSLLLIAAVTAVVELAGLPPMAGALAVLIGCVLILAHSVWRASLRKSG